MFIGTPSLTPQEHTHTHTHTKQQNTQWPQSATKTANFSHLFLMFPLLVHLLIHDVLQVNWLAARSKVMGCLLTTDADMTATDWCTLLPGIWGELCCLWGCQGNTLQGSVHFFFILQPLGQRLIWDKEEESKQTAGFSDYCEWCPLWHVSFHSATGLNLFKLSFSNNSSKNTTTTTCTVRHMHTE